MTKIMIIGEAWGREEALAGLPFVGASGQELTKMLGEAGIERRECFLTNVFNIHPPGNDIGAFLGTEVSALAGYPAYSGKRYIQRRYADELGRLKREIVGHKPNVCICLGNTAMWAMVGKGKIGQYRGCVSLSTHTVPGIKCLPTYHPAAVIRDWGMRPTVVLDLQKAKRQSEFPEVRYPKREIWINPTLEDLDEFYARYLERCGILSVDIETSGDRITCIGFAPSPALALVVPFHDPRAKDRSYWRSERDESEAWGFVHRVLAGPSRKLFQNGAYDIAFLWRQGLLIRVNNAAEDTMLLHHSLQPEALKGLGYLGSIYTEERQWKVMRSSATIKQDS